MVVLYIAHNNTYVYIFTLPVLQKQPQIRQSVHHPFELKCYLPELNGESSSSKFDKLATTSSK